MKLLLGIKVFYSRLLTSLVTLRYGQLSTNTGAPWVIIPKDVVCGYLAHNTNKIITYKRDSKVGLVESRVHYVQGGRPEVITLTNKILFV